MPETFTEQPLIDLADLLMGQSPDSQYVYDELDRGMPFLQGNAEFGDSHPHPIYSCTRPARACRKDDVLISVRAPVGEINLADAGYCIGRGLAAIRFHDIPATLGAKLVSKFSPALKRVAQGTTFEAIGKLELSSLRVLVPPSSEWWKIAQILDTLDTQIRQTEALIAKLERIKQGLLTDLLTRGIDDNGQLRPTPDQAPHLYKDSPLGLIPKEWNLAGVLDVASEKRQAILTGPFGAQLGQSDFVESGVPVLRIGNVQSGFIDWSDVLFVSLRKACDLERFRILPGDLLFARQGATTGRNALADARCEGALINYHIIRVAVDHNKCDSRYLWSIFNSETATARFNQEKGRGTREGINSAQIGSLRFALPPIVEQRELMAVLSEHDVNLDCERAVIAKLREQRSGLVDDLLTGRVRVTPLLDAPEQAAG